MKPNPIPCHHVMVSDVINAYWPLVKIYHQCLIWFISSISDSIDTMMKEGGGGEKPSNPYVIPITSQGCFGVGLCWNLGMF